MVEDYSSEAANFRAEIKIFLDENLPSTWAGMGAFTPDERKTFVSDWRKTLSERQLLAARTDVGWTAHRRRVLA